jgi:hypothetical protein
MPPYYLVDSYRRYHIRKVSPLDRILSRRIHSTPSHSKLIFNIVLFRSRSLKWYCAWVFRQKFSTHFSFSPPSCMNSSHSNSIHFYPENENSFLLHFAVINSISLHFFKYCISYIYIILFIKIYSFYSMPIFLRRGVFKKKMVKVDIFSVYTIGYIWGIKPEIKFTTVLI